ncbi:hypothetical protein MSAN_01663800 [Mycena sanguinolenta]|uniref:Uncharacterized protein n=1 Tax=Mycena sanguinolenta TaxID=230812 RepID=A0A8H6XZ58_9AGAR|nr:hypothetical protein MSAN_01663800 [Mycena sanguinolenta]
MSSGSLLEIARRRRAARPPPSTPVNTDTPSSPSPVPSLTSPQSQPDATPADATPNPFIGTSSSIIPQTERLKNFGERALKRIKLSDESQAEFRQYIETSSLDERHALQFIHTLQVEDLLNKEAEERNSAWKPSKALAKTLREYIWTLLLLPNIQYYAGTVENAVISAARSNKVKGLPAANSNESPELVKWLGREFSIFRSDMKSAVKASIEDGSEFCNIANLAEELLQHAPGVNHTLGLYHRLAFIRRHLRMFNHSIHDFWPKIDEELEELHDAGPEDFVESMKLNFEEDITIYEDPVKSTHRPCSDTFNDSCLKDLKTLSALAPKIQRVAARKRANKTKKRKQREPDVEEDEEPSADSLPADEGSIPEVEE